MMTRSQLTSTMLIVLCLVAFGCTPKATPNSSPAPATTPVTWKLSGQFYDLRAGDLSFAVNTDGRNVQIIDVKESDLLVFVIKEDGSATVLRKCHRPRSAQGYVDELKKRLHGLPSPLVEAINRLKIQEVLCT